VLELDHARLEEGESWSKKKARERIMKRRIVWISSGV